MDKIIIRKKSNYIDNLITNNITTKVWIESIKISYMLNFLKR